MKKILALFLAALMLVSFVACGDEAEKAEGKAETAEENKEAADKNADDTIVVGYTIYEPMNYMDGDELVGFDTELAKAVFEKLGYKVVFKEINWDNKYTELDGGSIDCIWNGFTANTADPDGVARADKVDFSYNYMGNKQVIVAKSSLAKDVKEAKDLAGKAGAVENGSAGEAYMDKSLAGTIKKGVTAQMDAVKDVKLGSVDFAVVDEQLAKANVGKGDYADLEIIEGVYSEAEYYAIGFKKGSALTAKVNAALEELAADGTLTKLAEKYNVVNTTIVDFADQK